MSSFYRATENGLVLRVRVRPRAKKRKLEVLGGCLRVYLESAPKGEKANQELISYFSKIFSVKKKEIKILRGKRGKVKEIFLGAVDEECLFSALNALKSD